MSEQYFDVLIIGAGISGIGMGCHLSRECPDKSFAILERRQGIGGTWDLFKYPGIRSDSDMFTFGFNFKPWTEPKVLADGHSIKSYVTETAEEYGVKDKIKFGIKITKANWCSEQGQWTLTAEDEADGTPHTFHCNFLVPCTGYYNYDQGYMPEYKGVEQFQGQLIHPQHWPEDLDYSGKKVVVIGSGATAVTLVPAMAGTASHVTMLQRSPTYIISVPALDPLAKFMQKFLPESWVYKISRKRNIALQLMIYYGAKRYPNFFRKLLLGGVKKQLPEDQMRHFTPSYDPWDQRLCAVPNGDLFKVIRNGQASVVTDHIETFTSSGLKLKSGETLDADIIVSATGLNVRMLGGIEMSVDGETREPQGVLTYKAVLVQDAPNLAAVFGYTNAPWTLKADLAAEYICRLINHMDKNGYSNVRPRATEDCAITEESVMDALNSGYVKRGAHNLPRQGTKLPWRVMNHYKSDKKMMLKDPIEDEYLEFQSS